MSATFFRRRLPHYDPPRATYFITACLAGSIPASGNLSIRRERIEVANLKCPANVSQQQWRLQGQRRVFAIQEDWLDGRPGVQWLKDPRLATIVVDELKNRSETWFTLHAYVVMPSHVHWVFSPRLEWVATLAPSSQEGSTVRSLVVRSIKGRSARSCNRVLNRSGAFWQAEAYDRVVRNSNDLQRVIDYVHFNPVKAGLCERPEEWEFSSAGAT